MGVDRIVRRASSIAAVTLLVLVTGTVVVLLVPALRGLVSRTPAPDAVYPVGTLIDLPAALYASNDRTLLIFGRSSCVGCQRAKPLFRAAASQVRGYDRWAVHLISTGHLPEDEESYRAELDANIPMQLVDAATLRLRRVPSLIVVDTAGTVLMSREGIVYSPDVAQAILAEIAQADRKR